MTQDTVKKVIKLSQDIRDAKDCLRRLQNKYSGGGAYEQNRQLDWKMDVQQPCSVCPRS